MNQAEKTFLIFGGVGGIGEALEKSLSEKGHTVFVTAREESLSKTREGFDRDRALTVDVFDEASIRAAVQTAGANGLDGIAYCVGSIDLKPLARTSAADLAKSFQLNVVGAFVAVQEAAPMLQDSQGSVVLFSSIAAQRGFALHTGIGTAKAGVEGLARSLAAELAPKVRVNVIAPSLSDTPLAKSFTQSPKIAETIASMHPIPRLGDASEIASLAEFLLLPSAAWITGQVFHIDGGRSSIEKK